MTVDTLDREALHAKYRAERDKRIRADGIKQWQPLTVLADDAEKDPYTTPKPRDPVTDHVDFLFLGGGFAGLTVCAALKDAGYTDLRILESGGDFGGVWYWNRFPGAMCDTAAMVYLPLLEETGHTPTAKYVRGPEILAQAHRIGRKYDLYKNALFSTHLETLTWEEDEKRWRIRTRQGDNFTATHVAMGTGPLNKPHLPGIKGINSFKGEAFHTARWDFNVTGGGWGDEESDVMTKLKNKRVGIIGTGATAVQCIPRLGRDSGELFVFQRTPSAVDIRNNHPIDPEWFAKLEPGWQEKWLANFNQLQITGYASEDLVKDGWTDNSKRIFQQMIQLGVAAGKKPEELTRADFMAAYHVSDDSHTEMIRKRVDETVSDKQKAQDLKAWYRQFCKRPCYHDEYLPTFNRETVHLVDTDGKGVEQIDETGVWVNGKHYDLDVIVYASGFDFGSDYTYKSSLEVYGVGGQSLTDAWKDGMKTFQGMHAAGFPNLFQVSIFQGSMLASNVTSNYPHQGKTLVSLLNKKKELGAKVVTVTQKSEDAWVDLILQSPPRIIGGPECTPGYYNAEGQESGRKEKLNGSGFPAGPIAFFEYIEDWRQSGRFDGLEFDGKPAVGPEDGAEAPTGVPTFDPDAKPKPGRG